MELCSRGLVAVVRPRKLGHRLGRHALRAERDASPASNVQPSRRPDALNTADFLQQGQLSPRFFSPLLAPQIERAGRDELPLLLYLPGIDGTGLIASSQFPGLAPLVDVQALLIPVDDRTPFEELVTVIVAHVRLQRQLRPPGCRVLLLGESFGGLLALAAALELGNGEEAVAGLVLVNPATSFPQSAFRPIAPAFSLLPDAAWRFLPIALTPVLADPPRILAAALAAAAAGKDQPPAARAGAALNKVLDIFIGVSKLADILPKETLAFKLSLLERGSTLVNPRLSSINVPVLLIVGEQDLLLPSSAEGTRLAGILPECTVIRAAGGHSTLQGNDFGIIFSGLYLPPPVDLGPLLTTHGFLSSMPRPKTGRLSKWCMPVPRPQQIESALTNPIKLTRQLTSPIFFSTDANGRVQRGLGAVPWTARPLLFIGNHQTFAADLGVLVEHVLLEHGVLLRGLAHPAVFAAGFGDQRQDQQQSALRPLLGAAGFDNHPPPAAAGDASGLRSTMSRFGAVPVSGRNLYTLLEAGEAVLLYPGGVREAYKRRGEDYQLFWPSKPEFIRFAAKLGAIVVTVAAVGAEDGVEMLLDNKELLRVPGVGDWLRSRSAAIPRARSADIDASGGESGPEEVFIAPLATLKPPARWYFKFGAPWDAQAAIGNSPTPEKCAAGYRRVKTALEMDIAWLREHAAMDPYRELGRRLLYEAAFQGKKQAPTFPLD